MTESGIKYKTAIVPGRGCLKIKRKMRFLVRLFLFLVIGYAVNVSISICLYANKSQTQKADVAIVLGAGVENEEPSPVFKERINHAILLYQDGYVGKIIFTGGVSKGNKISDSTIAGNYALENGVDAEAILIEDNSTITQENLKFAKQIMEENGLSTALIVSDPLHMKELC